jgi:hypothetical protein
MIARNWCRLARRGALLPVVLVVMVIIGLIAGAATFVGRQDTRAGRMAQLQASALAAVDHAHAAGLSGLSADARVLGDGRSLTRQVPVGIGVEASISLLRLDESTFVLFGHATAGGGERLSAQRSASVILRLDVPEISFPAAITIGTSDPVDAVVDGTDRSPPDWRCPPDSSDVPPIVVDAPLPPDDSALAALRSRATIRLPGGVQLGLVGPVYSGGECAPEVSTNWGDPSRTGACAAHLPIIHSAGDLVVGGGVGQGVLLVDGDLTLSGGFDFVGAVLVRGTLAIEGAGTTLTGGVRAGSFRGVAGDSSRASMKWSTCALRAALTSGAPLVLVGERPWALIR